MSWHDPLSDWDTQYIPTRGEACARRFLCLACTSSEAELSVPHTMARGTALSCTWESRPLALEEDIFGKKASPSCPRARRGAGFTESGSTPLHTAMSCWGAELLGGFGRAGCSSLCGSGSAGLSQCRCLRPQLRCHIWERARRARDGSRAEAALPSSSRLQEEVGYQLLS